MKTKLSNYIVVESLSSKWQHTYYRSSTQTEIDLVLEGPGNEVWAIEIKKPAAPVLSKGFHTACEDIKATKKIVVYSGTERFSKGQDTEAIGLIELLQLLSEEN